MTEVERPEHDLSTRCWGRNYEIMEVQNGGRFLRIALWATPLPTEGDFLLLSQPEAPDGRTRYQVNAIDPCHNPKDMAFADVVFSPRQHLETSHG